MYYLRLRNAIHGIKLDEVEKNITRITEAITRDKKQIGRNCTEWKWFFVRLIHHLFDWNVIRGMEMWTLESQCTRQYRSWTESFFKKYKYNGWNTNF